ncbi:MAG: citramalate synthase, partial [Bacillota bacterium]
LDAGTKAVAIFGKSWDLHITEILKATLDENLELVYDTLKFFKDKGKEVVFDAEHFYDGYKANPEYAIKVLEEADRAGADTLCLCDTNGGCFPDEIYKITKTVADRLPGRKLGIHCHNDIGCAIASSMLSVEAGVTHIQGTFIGVGERCGNADLSVIIPNLQLKKKYQCIEGNLTNLSETVIKIYEISNMIMPANKPYVGSSAFAHKGGMHIDGVNKCSYSFEHIPPEKVGNKRRFLMSEVSGRTTVLAKLSGMFPELTKKSPKTAEIVDEIKKLEHEGYQFESSDASFELVVRNILGKYKPHFKLHMYKTGGEFPCPDGEMNAHAMLKIEVDGKKETVASLGNGPVHALDLALRKALCVFYPQLKKVHLTDYKVRVLAGEQATAAKVRVLIESSDGKDVWTTVGVSTDIIEASWKALVDSIEYILYKKEVN